MKLPSFDRNDGREPISYEQHTHNSATAVAFNPGTPSKVPTKLGKTGQQKAGKVMKEFYHRSLHHGGSGEIVTDPKVAKAIAMSKGREAEGRKRKK